MRSATKIIGESVLGERYKLSPQATKDKIQTEGTMLNKHQRNVKKKKYNTKNFGNIPSQENGSWTKFLEWQDNTCYKLVPSTHCVK
jgi:hypothetical protein